MAEQLKLGFCAYSVQAGFPSPAEDVMQDDLDLNQYLIKRPSATFLMRVAGNSMHDAGIDEGDILVVDKSLPCRDGSIIIAVIDGEFTVKRYRQTRGTVRLCAENPDYADIPINESHELVLWGVVRGCVKQFVS